MTPTPLENNTDLHPSEATLDESLDSLSGELGRISAEILSINSGFQAQMPQVLAELRENLENQYRERYEQTLEELREQVRLELLEQFQKEFQNAVATQQLEQLEKTKTEIGRVSQKIEDLEKEIAVMLDDPDGELAKVIRKRNELVELKSFLSGLRFSVGE